MARGRSALAVPVDRMRDLRSERRLSIRELAQRANVSDSTLSYIERKGYAMPDKAEAVARAFGVEIAELSRIGLVTEEVRRRTKDLPPVRVGNSYNYPPFDEEAVAKEVERVVGEPLNGNGNTVVKEAERTVATESKEAFVEPPRATHQKVEHTYRLEIDEGILARVDRALEVLEALVTMPKKGD